jgi:hypothetical protein
LGDSWWRENGELKTAAPWAAILPRSGIRS